MTTAYKSIAVISMLMLTALITSCDQNRPSTSSSTSSANDKDVPTAIRYEDHIWANGVPPPGGALSHPQAHTAQSPKDGEALYSSMNCDGCHGGGGSGAVGPNLADGRWRYGGRDDEIFNSIFYGRPKGMPAFGGLIGAGGVWLLVDYLKSLSKPDSVPTLSSAQPQEAQGHPGQHGTTGASTQ